ncbi:hypothetical protein THAOC_36916 [Thalassiosira oceanica]|uniref:Uncharacterized protein n=1 Tax=Thalassiosira oceanica TaxID=159749 RepID=K0R117_THAOC|nr:hypothetical protein THAOC_36916 [Thalassiosira oceanica]|eukprot:EJK44534.1 hypothetical protein THAOC_36916 [Thalassiosira oceanica]
MALRFIFLITLSVIILAPRSCNGFVAIRSPRSSPRTTQFGATPSQEDGPDAARDGSMAAATKELNFVPYGELAIEATGGSRHNRLGPRSPLQLSCSIRAIARYSIAKNRGSDSAFHDINSRSRTTSCFSDERCLREVELFARMAAVFSTDTKAVDEFSRVVWLYARSVMNKLSSPAEDEEMYKEQVKEMFENSLCRETAESIVASPDRAMSCWREISKQLHSLPATDPKALIETDKSIIIVGESPRLCVCKLFYTDTQTEGECTSQCEKVYASPVPLIYTRHARRFLSLWTLLLPCCLITQYSTFDESWLVVPTSAVLAFFLFGVDELAMQLEEPFSILPMQVFVDEIAASRLILIDMDEPDDR